MTAALLVAGCAVIAAGLMLLAGVVAVRIRRHGYDIAAAMAAYKERKAAGESLDILELEPEEALP